MSNKVPRTELDMKVSVNLDIDSFLKCCFSNLTLPCNISITNNRKNGRITTLNVVLDSRLGYGFIREEVILLAIYRGSLYWIYLKYSETRYDLR